MISATKTIWSKKLKPLSCLKPIRHWPNCEWTNYFFPTFQPRPRYLPWWLPYSSLHTFSLHDLCQVHVPWDGLPFRFIHQQWMSHQKRDCGCIVHWENEVSTLVYKRTPHSRILRMSGWGNLTPWGLSGDWQGPLVLSGKAEFVWRGKLKRAPTHCTV